MAGSKKNGTQAQAQAKPATVEYKPATGTATGKIARIDRTESGDLIVVANRLKKVETVQDDNIVTSYELTATKYRAPQGLMILDAVKLAQALSQELDYIYYTELAGAATKAAKALRDEQAKLERGQSNEREVLKKHLKAREAEAKYAAYPQTSATGDSFVRFVALVMSGSHLVNVEKAKYMLTALQAKSPTDTDVKKEIVRYVEESFSTRECELVKPYKCDLNLEKVQNLRKLATTYTLKWTERGIEANATKPVALWQQVMFEVFREAFKLAVDTNSNSEWTV